MIKIILVFGLVLISASAMAQIGDCKVKGSSIIIYDANGRYRSEFSISSSATLSGFSNSIIVVTKGSTVVIYNSEGRYKAEFSISPAAFVKNVVGDNILVEKSDRIITYDSRGRYLTERSK